MVSAIRAHWAQHDNAYPQCIELDPVSMKEFVETREVVRKGLAGRELPEGQQELLGVKLVVGESNALVAKDGTRVPLQA
ncbi:hypothetical protein ABIE32_001685 [Comamonas sp. 4034]